MRAGFIATLEIVPYPRASCSWETDSLWSCEVKGWRVTRAHAGWLEGAGCLTGAMSFGRSTAHP